MSDQTMMQMDHTTMQKLVFNSPPSTTLESTNTANKQDDYASATSVSERPKSTMRERYYARSFDQDSEPKDTESSDDDKNSESTDAEPSQPRKKNIVRRVLHSVCVSISGGNPYAPPLR